MLVQHRDMQDPGSAPVRMRTHALGRTQYFRVVATEHFTVRSAVIHDLCMAP